MISKYNFTSNLERSLFEQLKLIVGTTYTHNTGGTKNIKFIAGYPSDFKKYADDLPLIVIQRLGSPQNLQGEMGGKRIVEPSYYIHVFAGGYTRETHNEFMKNGIVDLIEFGFDNKVFNYKDYSGSPATVVGRITSNSLVLDTSRRDKINVFENHHGIVSLDLEIWIKN